MWWSVPDSVRRTISGRGFLASQAKRDYQRRTDCAAREAREFRYRNCTASTFNCIHRDRDYSSWMRRMPHGELLLSIFLCGRRMDAANSKLKGAHKREFDYRIYRAAEPNACPDGNE